MPEYTVYFSQVAGTPGITVTADDPNEAIELAWEKTPGSLCHQCAREVDLAGEWEPEVVTEDGTEVWTARNRTVIPSNAEVDFRVAMLQVDGEE